MSPVSRDLCILFADVSGGTRLHEKLGDTEAMYAVERCLKRMERATVGFKGRVVKTTGDEIMAVFEQAEDAMQAACEMQLRVEDLPPASGVKLAIRVGFDTGAVLEEDNELLGDTVVIAARMMALARPGQIVASGEAVNHVSPLLRESTRAIETPTGEAGPVFEVIWQDPAALAAQPASVAPALPTKTWLRLRHGNREVIVDQDLPAVSLGRDSHNDLVIKDPRASRTHGRIERRREKFVVVDQSTNGTYVAVDGEAEVVLKREEAILRGRGRLSFGHAYGEGADEVVEFEVMY